MNTTLIVILIIFAGIVLFVAVNLFTHSLNDFLEKMIKKTLWIWLPFHAFKRLTREFKEKYLK